MTPLRGFASRSIAEGVLEACVSAQRRFAPRSNIDLMRNCRMSESPPAGRQLRMTRMRDCRIDVRTSSIR